MSEGSLPDGAVQLDELEILSVVGNQVDTLSSVDQGGPQIPEILYLAAQPTLRWSVVAFAASLRDGARWSVDRRIGREF